VNGAGPKDADEIGIAVCVDIAVPCVNETRSFSVLQCRSNARSGTGIANAAPRAAFDPAYVARGRGESRVDLIEL